MEDFPVDNLIKELSDFIHRCGKDEESTKVCLSPKPKKSSCGKDGALLPKATSGSSGHNKRKRGIPKEQNKKMTENESKCRDGSKQVIRLRKDEVLHEYEKDEDSVLTIMETKKKKRKLNNEAKMEEISPEMMDFMVKSSIDEQLQRIAVKEKLTQTHVKNIIKEVITDKSVLAMLRNTVYGFEPSDLNSAPVYEPKLTRAKIRELNGKHLKSMEEATPNLALQQKSKLTKASPSKMFEIKSLILEDFPEEEDDEEYCPEEQAVSDEESACSSSFHTSSPMTTPSHASESSFLATPNTTLPLHRSSFGTPSSMFKVPNHLHSSGRNERSAQRFLDFEAGDSSSLICSRTRSKFSMTDTPLESLEMAFEPPDITSDMYETEVDDEDWKNFLLDFVQPREGLEPTKSLSCSSRKEIDVSKGGEEDEADPEYNMLADVEEETPSFEEIREELRGDNAVRISKKELSQLMTEYHNSVENDEEEVQDSNSVTPETESNVLTVQHIMSEWSTEQTEILKCQLVQHIQLLTQSVLMTYYEDKFHFIEVGSKSMLNEIFDRSVRYPNCSVLHPFNLEAAMKTVQEYNFKRDDNLKYKTAEMERKMENFGMVNRKTYYIPQFPPCIEMLFLESQALPFPYLLPQRLFEPCCEELQKNKKQQPFLNSEYHLLTSSFYDVVKDTSIFELKRPKRPCFDPTLNDACRKVAAMGYVLTTGNTLNHHLRRILRENWLKGLHKDNPVVKYARTGKINLPKAKVEAPPEASLLPLKDMTPKFLPVIIQKMIEKQCSKPKKVSKKKTSKKVNRIKVSRRKKEKIIFIKGGKETRILMQNLSCSESQTELNQNV